MPSLGQNSSGAVMINGVPYFPNEVFAVLENDTLSIYRNNGQTLIGGAYFSDIDYVLTDSAFGSLDQLESFVNGHFSNILDHYPSETIPAVPEIYLRDSVSGSVFLINIADGVLFFDGIPICLCVSKVTGYWIAKEDPTPPTEAEFLAGHAVSFVSGGDVPFDLRYISSDLFFFLAEPITEPVKNYKFAGPSDAEYLSPEAQFSERQDLSTLGFYASNYATSNTTNIVVLKQV